MARGGSSSPADSLERSAGFWLRAYPRRWRAAFGDDFVGVLAETADPDARRVGPKEAAAIVQAGWALRLREHPPLLPWLAYRGLDRRLPSRYESWVADDLFGSLWFLRFMCGPSIIWCTVMWFGVADQQVDEMLRVMAPAVVGAGLVCFFMVGAFGTRKRRAVWQRHISPEVPWSLLSLRDREQMQRDAGRA